MASTHHPHRRDKMKQLALAFALLAGCAPPHYVWVSGDATLRAAFRQNSFQCRMVADRVAFIPAPVNVYDNNLKIPITVGITTYPINSFDYDVYEQCMIAAGY